MCNHRVGRITTTFDSDSSAVTCAAQHATAAAEQISIHYGDRSVSHMLLFSGFVPPCAAAHDFLPLWLRLPPPPPEAPHTAAARTDFVRRKRLLEAAGVRPGPYRVARDALDADALRFVRALALSGDALEHAPPGTLDAPLALAALERHALQLLRGAIVEMRDAYALPPADDDGADDATAAAVALSHAQLARKLVARERAVLADHLALIERRIEAESERESAEQ